MEAPVALNNSGKVYKNIRLLGKCVRLTKLETKTDIISPICSCVAFGIKGSGQCPFFRKPQPSDTYQVYAGHGGDVQVEFLDTVAESKIYLTSAGSEGTPNSEAGVG